MKLEEYLNYDGLGLAELVRNGEVTAQELVDCARLAIELANPQINAVIETFEYPDSAAAPNAPFAGVPFVIKDLVLHVAGRPNEMGSRLAQGLVTPHDSDLMKSFRNAGLVTIARTATPEFGFCVTTESVATGPTRNPWDVTRMPGGSSGGSAAAVAAGIAPIGHANDGGGSIRIPASCCGLVGMKPTRARTPSGPDVGEGLNGFGIEFAVTRTVRDAAALLDAVAVGYPGDPYVAPAQPTPYLTDTQLEPRRLKIAYTNEPWGDAPVDDELKRGLVETMQLCEDLGHHLIAASPVVSYPSLEQASKIIWAANMPPLVDYVSTITGRAPGEDTLEATTLATYLHGKQLSAADLLHALAQKNHISRAVAEFFTEYDVLLTPTVAKVPQPLGTYNANDPTLGFDGWFEHLFSFAAFTGLFNVTGQPAISLPLHRTKSNLPLGMQFVGGFGDETTLFQLAAQLEHARPWPLLAPLLRQ